MTIEQYVELSSNRFIKEMNKRQLLLICNSTGIDVTKR